MLLGFDVREWGVYLRLVAKVFPKVQRELALWMQVARKIPDPELKRQAISSIKKKKFHCMGGAVLALGGGRFRDNLIRAIVAIQTISDYLDNLCDRAGSIATLKGGRMRESFMLLHEAFMCATDPVREQKRYYGLYPVSQQDCDGDYLDRLVETSRSVIASLPSIETVRKPLSVLSLLYSQMQSTKHLETSVREDLMAEWARKAGFIAPEGSGGLEWWEFGAASGSTLGIFALLSLASRPKVDQGQVKAVLQLYFPWVSALHILLDYLIDLEEDSRYGDLNFVAQYSGLDQAVDRISEFFRKGWELASRLGPDAHLHRALLRGLVAMYFSDSKAARYPKVVKRLTSEAGFPTGLLLLSCRGVRKLDSF